MVHTRPLCSNKQWRWKYRNLPVCTVELFWSTLDFGKGNKTPAGPATVFDPGFVLLAKGYEIIWGGISSACHAIHTSDVTTVQV